MIFSFTAFIGVLLICPSWGDMSDNEFETFIEKICFNPNDLSYINGQEKPLASTLENFIALAEKFEIANSDIGLKEELFYFIRNYTYTNIEFNGELGDISRWTPKSADYEKIDAMWEPDVNKRISHPKVEDPFTDAEKCSLYFMISHSIIRKARTVGVQRSVPLQNNYTSDKWGNEIDNKDDDIYPLEQGVVAIQGTDEAVSLGRVLTGIYVGMAGDRKNDISTLKNTLPPENIPPEGNIVDSLFTLTIAEVIAIAGWRFEAGKRQLFVGNGEWISVPLESGTSNVCPMVYKLRAGTEQAYSYSSLRGAADGLILGKISKSIENRKRDTKLSQILRQYYSRGGLVEKTSDMDGEIRATFCNREFLLNKWDQDIKEQVTLFMLLASSSYGKIGDMLSFSWKQYSDAKTMGVFQNKNSEIKDYCGATLSVDKPEDLPIETPWEVIALINTDTTVENIKKQQLIIGSLAKKLQLSYFGSRMTIFTHQKLAPSTSAPGIIQLRTIVDETYSPACAACSVTQMERDGTANGIEEEVILALNQYLTTKKENETKYSGVNGKVLILFNFGEDVPVGRPTAEMINLQKALTTLHLTHPDLAVYALGKNLAVLKKYARNDEAFVMSAFDLTEDNVAKALYSKIIAAPARLQFSDCNDGRSEKTAVFEDFITPNTVQHWAMPAEYFYKSFHLKFLFESFYGTAKVCCGRIRSPENQGALCKDIIIGKPTEFKYSDPCIGQTQLSCNPYYISVLGVNITDGTDRDYCDDKTTENKCRTLDQIKFKVYHEGIRCSGSMGLFAPSLIVLFGIIVFHLFSKFA